MITAKIIKLARSMSEFEGWQPSGGSLGPLSSSLSYRNHNPGNLRWSSFMLGTREGFAVFINDEVGFWAMMYDIWLKAQGKTITGLNGESTIEELIKMWTTDPVAIKERYIAHVERFSGLSKSTKLKDLLKP